MVWERISAMHRLGTMREQVEMIAAMTEDQRSRYLKPEDENVNKKRKTTFPTEDVAHANRENAELKEENANLKAQLEHKDKLCSGLMRMLRARNQEVKRLEAMLRGDSDHSCEAGAEASDSS